MARDEKVTAGLLSRLPLAFIGVLGLWLLVTWFLSAPRSSASGSAPTPLAWQSPIGSPQLSIAKRVDNDAPTVDDLIEYTVSYSNTNAGSQAFNVRLYDFLPAGVQLVSTSPAYTDFSNGVLRFDAPSVGPGTGDVDVTVQVRVLDGYTELVNYALVTADCVTPTYVSLLTPVTQPPPSVSVLRLVKDGDAVALVGSEVVYTLSCENSSSDAPAEAVSVVDVLPAGMTLVGASPWPNVIASPMLQWDVGDLAPGGTWQAVITATAPTAAGVVTNTALAGGQQAAMTQTVLATRVFTQAAILHVTKGAAVQEVDVGDDLAYTIQYWNSGNLTATQVVLTDTLPTDVVVSGASPLWADSGPGWLAWDIGSLGPGISGTVLVTVTVGEPGHRTLHNVVDVAGLDGYQAHAEHTIPVRFIETRLPLVLRYY